MESEYRDILPEFKYNMWLQDPTSQKLEELFILLDHSDYEMPSELSDIASFCQGDAFAIEQYIRNLGEKPLLEDIDAPFLAYEAALEDLISPDRAKLVIQECVYGNASWAAALMVIDELASPEWAHQLITDTERAIPVDQRIEALNELVAKGLLSVSQVDTLGPFKFIKPLILQNIEDR